MKPTLRQIYIYCVIIFFFYRLREIRQNTLIQAITFFFFFSLFSISLLMTPDTLIENYSFTSKDI